MEKKMEAIGIIGIIEGIYRDNGKKMVCPGATYSLRMTFATYAVCVDGTAPATFSAMAATTLRRSPSLRFFTLSKQDQLHGHIFYNGVNSS